MDRETEVKPAETVPATDSGKPREPVYEAVICERADREAEPVIQPRQSPVGGTKLATIGRKKEPIGQAEAAPCPTVDDPSQRPHGRSPLAERKARVETSIESSSARGRHLAPPSSLMTGSSFEPLEERRRILDFEDIYTARQEGELVGIGARSKVSTFVPPGIETALQQPDEVSGKQVKPGKSRTLVLTSSDVVSGIGNGAEGVRIGTPSPAKETVAEKVSATRASPSVASPPGTAATPPNVQPSRTAEDLATSKQAPTSRIDESKAREPVVVPSAQKEIMKLEVGISPTNGAARGPVYDQVICQRADKTDPAVRPVDLVRRDAAARGETLEDPYEVTGGRKLLPPLDVVAEEEASATFPRRTHKSQGEACFSWCKTCRIPQLSKVMRQQGPNVVR